MTDLQIVGVWLLLVVPLMVLEATAYVPAGFDSAFWALPLAEKLPRIAAEEQRWLRMARVWIALPLVVSSGFLAAGASGVGSGAWLWLGVGLGVVSGLVAVVLFAFQGQAIAVAARGGTVPDWLGALWATLSDLERTYILGTSLASVLVGIGLLDGSVFAGWVPWSLIVGPTVVAAAGLATDFYFPHMALLGPIILGVAMVLT